MYLIDPGAQVIRGFQGLDTWLGSLKEPLLIYGVKIKILPSSRRWGRIGVKGIFLTR